MSSLKAFSKNEDGHFAVISALLAVPLALVVGFALDLSFVLRHDTNAQAALDAAVLASVIPGDLTDQERAEYAKEVFYKNYASEFDYNLDVVASREIVSIYASVDKPSLMGGMIGKDHFTIELDSTAVHTKSDIVCVMTLADTGDNSLVFDKKAELNAPGCSVQVNSSSNKAMVSTASESPFAKSFCVHGNYTGNFPKTAKAACTKLEDPYANVRPPADLSCDYGTTDFLGWLGNIYMGGPGATLSPGVYCGGLHINDTTIKLEPGTYVMRDGALTIGHNATVVGEDVTIIFTGDESVLYTYEDVKIDLTAPKYGDYKGLVFYQDRTSTINAGLTSLIKGGADIRLVGTMYFPTQNLFVGGIGTMGASSPAMAFIANNITFTSDVSEVVSELDAKYSSIISLGSMAIAEASLLGYTSYQASALGSVGTEAQSNFLTNIQTDAVKAGLPPILPRSDEGSRLIQSPPKPQ